MTGTKKTATKKAPAKKAAAKRPTDHQSKVPTAPKAASSASDFKKRKKGRPLQLPSGLVVLARSVEMQQFIQAGEVPNALMPIVEEALAKGGAVDPRQLMDSDSEQVDMKLVREMYEMLETLVIMAVTEPSIHPRPEAGEEEDEDLVYITDIEEEDKMFIYQWAIGGTDDVATFREEAKTSLAPLAQG